MSTSVTMRMTEGRPERVIVSFALPIFISQLFQQIDAVTATQMQQIAQEFFTPERLQTLIL